MSALFPALSTALARSEEEIQESLLDVRERLGPERFEAYLNSLQHLHEDPPPEAWFGAWYLHQYCLFAGFLQAIVRYNGSRVAFRFGVEIAPWEMDRRAAELYELPAALTAEGPGALMQMRHLNVLRDHRFTVRVILPARLATLGRNIIEQQILPFARNTFFYTPGLGDPRRIDHLAVLNQRALAVLNRHLERGEIVTISHFKFQDLHIYLEMQGEHRTREILRGIIEYIHGNLKKRDLLLQLTPLSYIMLSPGATQEQILERFRSIYFQIRSLVLEYQIHLATVTETPVQLNEIWKELKL